MLTRLFDGIDNVLTTLVKRQSARQHSADTTIDMHHHHVASHSPFPSPISSFVPPPMSATHEYAGVKRASAPALNGAGKKRGCRRQSRYEGEDGSCDCGVSCSRDGRNPYDAYSKLRPRVRAFSLACRTTCNPYPSTPTQRVSPYAHKHQYLDIHHPLHIRLRKTHFPLLQPPRPRVTLRAPISPPPIPLLQTPLPALPIPPVPR
ncbi:hypothetical protein M422DRAFT_268215 [Sphaerobolus stellatus SS14]|uniref:Uncharacterized protein n=1 Tax=Sphaerobolus stellatus (strain SS14) TaxID=990650 RepID=A0A0C9UN27_SPHS4|nr:hypothetical protein M422DRAFT_268215 [Sphaerobolus stellatus SS14]